MTEMEPENQDPRLAAFRFLLSDPDQTLRFYRDGLGLKLCSRWREPPLQGFSFCHFMEHGARPIKKGIEAEPETLDNNIAPNSSVANLPENYELVTNVSSSLKEGLAIVEDDAEVEVEPILLEFIMDESRQTILPAPRAGDRVSINFFVRDIKEAAQNLGALDFFPVFEPIEVYKQIVVSYIDPNGIKVNLTYVPPALLIPDPPGGVIKQSDWESAIIPWQTRFADVTLLCRQADRTTSFLLSCLTNRSMPLDETVLGADIAFTMANTNERRIPQSISMATAPSAVSETEPNGVASMEQMINDMANADDELPPGSLRVVDSDVFPTVFETTLPLNQILSNALTDTDASVTVSRDQRGRYQPGITLEDPDSNMICVFTKEVTEETKSFTEEVESTSSPSTPVNLKDNQTDKLRSFIQRSSSLSKLHTDKAQNLTQLAIQTTMKGSRGLPRSSSFSKIDFSISSAKPASPTKQHAVESVSLYQDEEIDMGVVRDEDPLNDMLLQRTMAISAVAAQMEVEGDEEFGLGQDHSQMASVMISDDTPSRTFDYGGFASMTASTRATRGNNIVEQDAG